MIKLNDMLNTAVKTLLLPIKLVYKIEAIKSIGDATHKYSGILVSHLKY